MSISRRAATSLSAIRLLNIASKAVWHLQFVRLSGAAVLGPAGTSISMLQTTVVCLGMNRLHAHRWTLQSQHRSSLGCVTLVCCDAHATWVVLLLCGAAAGAAEPSIHQQHAAFSPLARC